MPSPGFVAVQSLTRKAPIKSLWPDWPIHELPVCVSYCSIAVKSYTAKTTLTKKIFHWGLAYSFRNLGHYIMAGSMATCRVLEP